MAYATCERVDARNAFNATCNEIEAHLLRILSEWQGRKIWKTSGYGDLTAKFAPVIRDYEASHGYNQKGDGCRIWISIRVQYNQIIAFVRDTDAALSADLYLGRVNDSGEVSSLSECRQRKTDYTLEGVIRTREKAYALECQARDLRRSIADFDK